MTFRDSSRYLKILFRGDKSIEIIFLELSIHLSENVSTLDGVVILIKL